jgi:hypothetical protein
VVVRVVEVRDLRGWRLVEFEKALCELSFDLSGVVSGQHVLLRQAALRPVGGVIAVRQLTDFYAEAVPKLPAIVCRQARGGGSGVA